MKQREIRFRAWDGQKMLPVKALFWSEDAQVEVNVGHDEPDWRSEGFSLMQFTGLKDKNGKDIYEGDLVRYNWRHTDGSRIGEALFDNGCWEIDDHDKNVNAHLMNANISNLEVIGNIHEHPELLSL